jgi:hypothetical protein
MSLQSASQSADLALLGFDRERWKRRRAELRARLAEGLTVVPRTVKSQEQLEAENVSYWTPDKSDRPNGVSDLRWKFTLEAEEARRRWHRVPARRPVEGLGPAEELSVTCPRVKTAESLKCDIDHGEIRVCAICGQSFHAVRSDASLCSGACRKRASRNQRSVTV